MRKDLLIILVGSVVLGGCLHNPGGSVQIDEPGAPVSESSLPTVSQANDPDTTPYQLEADVQGVEGSNIRGVARAGFINGEYVLVVGFGNVPPAESGYFYEGWVVRENPRSVVSTGPVRYEAGGVVNEFRSARDLTDHEKYILTIEPDDGDPAPAEHVAEGVFGAL